MIVRSGVFIKSLMNTRTSVEAVRFCERFFRIKSGAADCTAKSRTVRVDFFSF